MVEDTEKEVTLLRQEFMTNSTSQNSSVELYKDLVTKQQEELWAVKQRAEHAEDRARQQQRAMEDSQRQLTELQAHFNAQSQELTLAETRAQMLEAEKVY